MLPGFSQTSLDTLEDYNENLNTITTAFFLTIAPDSRSGAMGDLGVVFSDVYSLHWNSAKLAFCLMEVHLQFHIHHSSNLVPDISFLFIWIL